MALAPFGAVHSFFPDKSLVGDLQSGFAGKMTAALVQSGLKFSATPLMQ